MRCMLRRGGVGLARGSAHRSHFQKRISMATGGTMHSMRKLGTLMIILCALAISARAGDLETATPESQGMSSEKLALAKAFLGEHDTRAALVLRHGKIVAEWYWDGSGPDSDFDIQSSTKSVFSTAIGLLVDDGKLKLEDPACKWIPEWREDGRKDITIYQLVNMISGLSGKAPAGLDKNDRDADRLTLV